ncbi:MAG TPA: fructosamine kinase family protein [Conexibacter sp.]|jgi:fructosamine-3-kinase
MTPGRRTDGDNPALAAALAAALGRPVATLRAIAGGDLNDAYQATLDSGERIFVKTSADAAPGAYAGETASIRWLAVAQALPLPQALAIHDEEASADAKSSPRFLALQWIDAGRSTDASDEKLGRGLARLHAFGAPSFGGPDDLLRIGPIVLPNAPAPDWPTFYAERRLWPLARMAQERGALPDHTLRSLERVVDRLLHDAIGGPSEQPARLHGDLWGGNVLTDVDGQPWLIDPAAHGGHREVDLAMLRLFASPSPRCFAAYEEVTPLAPGAQERVALWQVAPLLLHAALFGGGYGARAAELLNAYL